MEQISLPEGGSPTRALHDSDNRWERESSGHRAYTYDNNSNQNLEGQLDNLEAFDEFEEWVNSQDWMLESEMMLEILLLGRAGR